MTHIIPRFLLAACMVALTLVALASGVFAQETATNQSGLADTTATTSTTTVAAPPVAAVPRDPYRKEMLPSKDVFGDFVVGPGRIDLEIAPGESRTVELTISNRMGDRRQISLSTLDAGNSEDENVAIQLLDDGEIGPYTIKDYISFPADTFWLDHAQRARVPVTISIPADAEPGGFYGSVITQIVSNSQDIAAGEVSASGVIISQIATLFFVRTPGEESREGQLTSFDTLNSQRLFLSGPIDFGIVFENTGTVHLNPAANITITNLVGDAVGFIQLSPWYVLPESVRTRQVMWDRELLFGRYVATVDVHREYDDIVDTATVVFWVLPWKYLLSIFIGLFVFFLIIRFFTSRFEFKRKT